MLKNDPIVVEPITSGIFDVTLKDRGGLAFAWLAGH